MNYRIAGYFQTSATILNFEELNFAQHHGFETKFSFLLWTNKSFEEFIFEDNVLNEIFENKFPSKITRYTVADSILVEAIHTSQTPCTMQASHRIKFDGYTDICDWLSGNQPSLHFSGNTFL